MTFYNLKHINVKKNNYKMHKLLKKYNKELINATISKNYYFNQLKYYVYDTDFNQFSQRNKLHTKYNNLNSYCKYLQNKINNINAF